MRIANLADRLVLLVESGAIDVERASDGRWGPDPMSPYGDWDRFVAWAAEPGQGAPFDERSLQAPVPRPSQVFAAGMNYRTRAVEGGVPDIALPPIFTKFPTCLTGPYATVELPTETVDWEAELVVVIARRMWRSTSATAWRHVAGVMVGQDLSERNAQFRPPVAQFSMAKSYPGFGPTGPWLLATGGVDPGPLQIATWVGDEQVQQGSTEQMLMPVADLLANLSANVALLPGDLVFTGSPGGVGHHRTPPRYLRPGDLLTTTIDRLGQQRVTLA
jgi:2,4-diketo-3-deoxy-L-fuconate hydrolase